ncbi:inactive serine protease 54 [Ahaetulla prasina]|uniref:inactive serine protease 54 n=1 Tax=Ahaetulla prasina TaxID=499056 RepID=UPI00264948FE|nr:inactive serine protease 54 [Ahaetulla prasina]
MKLVWWLSLLLVFWGSFLVDGGKTPGPPRVLTQNGELQGQRIRVRGAERDVEVFLGIPYAKSPIGSLRFSPPQLAEPWTGLRDATSYPPMCLQDPLVGQALSDAFANSGQRISLRIAEDCLYLNVYVPAQTPKAEPLPVMVWIHGGGLLLGAASTYDGSVLSAYENVVVVAIQYRLGILGFYSTGDEHARGNWGLLDQVAALQWIQENIANFGGDPGSVTIFGNSAGGFSSSAHVLSPLSKGLFHKAISESGVAVIDVVFHAHPEKLAKKIAGSISCPTSSSAEMVRCLRGKTESEILLATLKMDFTRLHLGGEEQHIILFPAVVDGQFFPKSPRELLAEKNFNNLPYIIGVNDDEFGWILPQLLQFPDFTKGLDRETVNLLLRSSEQLTRVAPQDLPLVADEYLQDLQNPVQLRDQFLALLRDAVFLAPAILTARHHRAFRCRLSEFATLQFSDSSLQSGNHPPKMDISRRAKKGWGLGADAGYPAYVYELQHRSSEHSSLRPDFAKVDHGDEIAFVFGKPFFTGPACQSSASPLCRHPAFFWRSRTQISALAGGSDPKGPGEYLVSIQTIVPHEAFDEITLVHNIALLETSTPLHFSVTVQPICFPTPDFPGATLKKCFVAGWPEPQGGTGPLQKLSVEDVDPCPLHRTVSTECCSHREGDRAPGCLGSAGNPVLCEADGRWVLKGLLSEGGARCYGPFLYSRLIYYSDWIVATMAKGRAPASPFPGQRHPAFRGPAEEQAGRLFEPFLVLRALNVSNVSEDPLSLNLSEELGEGIQPEGPPEARANPPVYYDYYGGELLAISSTKISQPRGLRGLLCMGFLLHLLAS